MYDRFLVRIRSQVRQAGEHFLDHDSFQLARDEVAEAEMQPVTEGRMVLLWAVQVKGVRIDVPGLVAIDSLQYLSPSESRLERSKRGLSTREGIATTV
jgi:hypothetical protein